MKKRGDACACIQVSILYLRCVAMSGGVAAQQQNSFNSLFEMLGPVLQTAQLLLQMSFQFSI